MSTGAKTGFHHRGTEESKIQQNQQEGSCTSPYSQDLEIAIFVNPANPVNPEPLAELKKIVPPVTSAV